MNATIGKSALVTGASRGIGLGIATRLATLGYSMTVTARDTDRLDATASDLRAAGAPEVHAVAGDLSDEHCLAQLTQRHEHGLAVYGATKAALISLVQTLNAEESGNGVCATAISPAYVDTDMSAWIHDQVAPEQMLEVGDVVAMVDGLLKLSSRAVVPNIVMTRAGTDGLRA
jgi:short-subunit dehydrogenase